MKKAIIFHGTLGSPEGNWFAWLKDQLEERGLEVWLPQLPNAEQPSLREWLDFVHDGAPFEVDEQTIIVGHSSGAILAYLTAQENFKPVGALVAVSVFHENSLNWEPNLRLFDIEFGFDKIKRKSVKRICIHSDDDPYVPLEQARWVADNSDSEFIMIPGQGHFNLEKSIKYKEFPKLLEILESAKILQ
jgi:predicted alpha/beta hydrolase family esterase